MSLNHVKAFYDELANNKKFRKEIQEVNSKEECSEIVKKAGYYFTTEEFEEYTSQLLESLTTDDELQELGEKELTAVFGGIGISTAIKPYGVPSRLWDSLNSNSFSSKVGIANSTFRVNG